MSGHTRYQKIINRGLDKAYAEAPTRNLDVDGARLVILSDHHKGTGDDADDFRAAMPAYRAALEHYYLSGHILAVLGDAEELWEDPPAPILETYAPIFELENEFHKLGRYWRFWGNHDDEWRDPSQVAQVLGVFFDELAVCEGLRIIVQDNDVQLGELFLVHGHQGTLVGDRWGWLSRMIVRFIWRPIQRAFRIKPNTPATDWRLRHRHDIAMYNWAADKENLVLVAGHTHNPIFPTAARVDKLTKAYESIKELSLDIDEVAEAKADLEFARAQEKPSYFNSGCCCFNDGAITGIEIVEGEIRLVRWPNEIGQLRPEILDKMPFCNVLAEVGRCVAPISISVEMG